nr:hypothetical protein CFP56_07866 [Quercus suber]
MYIRVSPPHLVDRLIVLSAVLLSLKTAECEIMCHGRKMSASHSVSPPSSGLQTGDHQSGTFLHGRKVRRGCAYCYHGAVHRPPESLWKTLFSDLSRKILNRSTRGLLPQSIDSHDFYLCSQCRMSLKQASSVATLREWSTQSRSTIRISATERRRTRSSFPALSPGRKSQAKKALAYISYAMGRCLDKLENPSSQESRDGAMVSTDLLFSFASSTPIPYGDPRASIAHQRFNVSGRSARPRERQDGTTESNDHASGNHLHRSTVLVDWTWIIMWSPKVSQQKYGYRAKLSRNKHALHGIKKHGAICGPGNMFRDPGESQHAAILVGIGIQYTRDGIPQ